MKRVAMGVILAGSLAFVVFAGEFPFDRYVPRTLKQVIELHAAQAEGTDGLISAQDFASRVMVTNVGERRPLSPRRADFLDRYLQAMGRPQFRSLYESEIHVREDGQDHWLPIQKPLLEAFDAEVKKGAKVTLYVTWMGGLKQDKQFEWLFSVNEFQAEDQQ